MFDQKIAEMIKKDRPNAVICYDSCAQKAFAACKDTGTLAVLDQSIGHLNAGLKILSQEKKLHPDFSDSINLDFPECKVQQCINECFLADKILVASDYVKDTIIELGIPDNKIIINPYGVDTNRFKPNFEKTHNEKFTILFVGSIGQRKGIKYLLESVRQLDNPNIQLILVGNTQGAGNGLKDYSPYFIHLNHVSHREIHSIYSSADIFVYPSLHEGSALSIYEAMASGLPVITTKNSGSVVRDGIDGFIVPLRAVNEIKACINRLYLDHELRKKMSYNARKRVEEFTWDAYHKRLAGFLSNAIEDQAFKEKEKHFCQKGPKK